MSGKAAQTLIMLELVSPEYPNDSSIKLTNHERDTIYKKYKQHLPWNDVFSDIIDGNTREKLIDLFNKLDNMKDSDE